MKRIELAERLLKGGVPVAKGEASNLCYHAARGKEAFWQLIKSILEITEDFNDNEREYLLEHIYGDVRFLRHRHYREHLKSIDLNVNTDQGMATPQVWFVVGWDNEAELLGLQQIQEPGVVVTMSLDETKHK